MTPSMDSMIDLLNDPDEPTLVEKIRTLTDEYDKGKMTRVEYLEELDGILNSEWDKIERRGA
jgi:hypothetical protein